MPKFSSGRFFKKLAAAAAAGALALGVFTGCGRSAEKVSLSVWCAEEDVPMIEKMVEDFKTANADKAELTVTISPEGEDTCKNTVLANPEGAADIFSFAADQFRELYAAGALLEVTENADKIIEASGGTENGAVKSSVADGKLYAYPSTASNGYFLYYNSKYYTEDDVKSFDRLLEVAAENGKKVQMQITSGWYLFSFFKGAGLDVGLNDDGVTNHCDWNTTEGKYTGRDVAEAILKITSHEGFKSGGDDILKEGAADGSIIAGISGTWLSTDMEAAFGDGYAAAKLPEYTVGGDSVQMCSFAGYKLMGVNAHTKEKKWAMRLAEWLTNEDNQMTRFRERGEGPANANAANSDEVKASPAIAALGEQSQFGYLENLAGEHYWTPTNVFGVIMEAKNIDNVDIQLLLDTLVKDITAGA